MPKKAKDNASQMELHLEVFKKSALMRFYNEMTGFTKFESMRFPDYTVFEDVD